MNTARIWISNEWVYAMFCEAPGFSSGWVKIGITERILERISAVQGGCPMPIKMVALIGCTEDSPAAISVEKRLHERFAHRRAKGEWFRFDFSDEDEKRDFNDGCREVFRELWGENHPWWWKTNKEALKAKIRGVQQCYDAHMTRLAYTSTVHSIPSK